jgi:ATP-dependent Clp protease adaptor protein ClpS
MAKSDTVVVVKPNLGISQPSLFNVVYVNDSVTTMEWVIASLIDHFNYDLERSLDVTQRVHNEGSAVVATLPYEIAEQKVAEITSEARLAEYPLIVRMESNE